MAALATTSDLEKRLARTLTGTELTRAEALLDDASAVVRSLVGQQFTAAAGDTVRLRARAGTIRLPQRPVTAVTAVVDTDGNAVAFDWYTGDRVTVYAVDGFYDVTYSHGGTVPDLVVGIVCNVVGRALAHTPDETANQSETVEGYSYTVGGAAAAGPVGLLDAERERLLAAYGRRAGSIALGMR